MRTDSPWIPPPKRLSLANDEVHVWRVRLDVPRAFADGLERNLSPDERARAARFMSQKDRQQFVVARGFLRLILGGYLETAPSQIRFATDSHGKPVLADSAGTAALRFNLSHSYPLALVAVTRGRDAGVDVERIRDDFDMESVASEVLSPNEISSIRDLAKPEQRKAFYDRWTCKEAYLKATGEGFGFEPNQFGVKLIPRDWSVIALDSIPGCAAALAVSGRGWKMRRFGLALEDTDLW